MSRLPTLEKSTDCGEVYVAATFAGHKIGFSRGQVERRVRDCGGVLLFTIRTGQRPSVVENIIHKRFAHRRFYGREWFDLSYGDLMWLRGLKLQ